MKRQRWINTLFIGLLTLVLLGIGSSPDILSRLPLSRHDKQLLEYIAAVWPEQITPSVTSPSPFPSPTSRSAEEIWVATPATALSIRNTVSTESARITRVIDGDTVELADGRVVRYIGIDTPETKHPTKGVECFGQEATALNRSLVEGRDVILEIDVSSTDRYGRLLRYVWLNDQLINWQLVAQGYAFALAYPPDIARQQSFSAAQQRARESGLGLWTGCP